jgi:hypothetical protein
MRTDLPTERPPIDPASSVSRGPFDWTALVGLAVHPMKVAIIEALLWVGHPLSIGELSQILVDAHYSAEVIGYHATALANLGVIAITHVRKVRGARENYYSLA